MPEVDLATEDALLAVFGRCERLSVGPDQGGAAVVLAGGILAHAVHGRDVAGVLDGPGARERVPGCFALSDAFSGIMDFA